MEDAAFNDHRTRRALDELADMLLTGPVKMPSPFVARPPEPNRGSNGKDKDTGNGGAASASGGPLRLHRPTADAPHTAMLEGVMLGHLPGFAGPWVAQYADLVAHADRGGRGLGLIRLAGSAVELELYGEAAMLGRFERRPNRCESLDAALAAMAEHVADYALLIDSPDKPEAREHLAAMDRWTVVTAANDAAIVAAYRLLKSLIVDAKLPIPPQGVRLSFAGCDEAAAVAAAERIARAGAAFLKATVKYAGVRSKMQPVRRVHVGRFDGGPDETPGVAGDPWRRVLAFFQPPDQPMGRRDEPMSDQLLTEDEMAALAEPDADELAAAANAGSAAADTEAARVMGAASHPIDDELEQRLIRSMQEHNAGKREPEPHPTPADADVATDIDAEADYGPPPQAAVSPPQSSPEPPLPGVASPDALAAYLDGARPLVARCPHHPDVQLAVDAEGHLALALAADADRTSQAIRVLLETRTWAAAHRPLLALTDPAAKLDAAADPVCHLFTDQPRVALQLAFAGLTDTRPIRLHLLKRIEVAGRPHFLHEPLS